MIAPQVLYISIFNYTDLRCAGAGHTIENQLTLSFLCTWVDTNYLINIALVVLALTVAMHNEDHFLHLDTRYDACIKKGEHSRDVFFLKIKITSGFSLVFK